MIDRNHELPVVRQCEVLALARSTVYYTEKPTSPDDLALMRRIGKHPALPPVIAP
jgi:putative transposase